MFEHRASRAVTINGKPLPSFWGFCWVKGTVGNRGFQDFWGPLLSGQHPQQKRRAGIGRSHVAKKQCFGEGAFQDCVKGHRAALRRVLLRFDVVRKPSEQPAKSVEVSELLADIARLS